MSLAEAENMAALQAVHSRGVWGHAPPGVLRYILVHSEAYREAHRAS